MRLPESDSDHMHRCAVMAFFCHEKGLDRDKCIKMALVHDLGEAIAGDITPFCGVAEGDKFAREKAAFEELAALAGPPLACFC